MLLLRVNEWVLLSCTPPHRYATLCPATLHVCTWHLTPCAGAEGVAVDAAGSSCRHCCCSACRRRGCGESGCVGNDDGGENVEGTAVMTSLARAVAVVALTLTLASVGVAAAIAVVIFYCHTRC